MTTLKGHLNMVQGIVMRQSTQEVVSAGKDGLILLWEPQSAEPGLDTDNKAYGDDWSDEEGGHGHQEDEATAFLPPILASLLQRGGID